MLHGHLPKPNKQKAKEALEDFFVLIIFLFAAKVTFKPISPQLLQDPASNLHHWRGPQVRARFFLPFTSLSLTTHHTDSKQDALVAVTDSCLISSRHGRWQQRRTQGPGRQQVGIPQQPSSIRKHHTLYSLLLQFLLKSSHLYFASTFATSNLFSHETFCFIITTCLHFLDCHILFVLFTQFGKKTPPPFPFRFLFLYLELSAKIPHEDFAFIAAVYFYLAILYPAKCSPPKPQCHLFSPLASASFHF